MAYVGTVKRSLAYQKYKVYLESVTGPAEDTTIAAGGSADISFTVNVPRDLYAAGVRSISGLPSGVYVSAVSVSGKNVTLTLVNTGASDVTVAANSITIDVVALA